MFFHGNKVIIIYVERYNLFWLAVSNLRSKKKYFGMSESNTLSSVQKACRILSVMGEPGKKRLTEIANLSGLNKVTTLRLLEVLAKEGFVVRDDSRKTYSLGDEAIVLSRAARARDDLRARARASLLRLAVYSEDTVLLSIRQGFESVVIDREVGNFPIRAAYMDIGSRRPLGVGAGSMAVFGAMSPQERETLMPEIARKLVAFPRYTTDFIYEEAENTAKRGYTVVLNQIIDRMGAIGVAILGLDGSPLGGLAIAALSDRVSSRKDKLLSVLQREAEFIADPKKLKPEYF